MPELLVLLTMSALLGLTSFGIGMLPLSFSFSRKSLSWLSNLGTGLLLGTALGVIIPEGIATMVESNSPSELPTSSIALSLLVGFSIMLLVEQLTSSHAHEGSVRKPSLHQGSTTTNGVKRAGSVDSEVEFDVELGELEHEQGIPTRPEDVPVARSQAEIEFSAGKPAFPLTIGLVLHGLADGLALGVSALPTDSAASSDLSFVVFFALAVHKAPTTLAYATSLLTTSLSRSGCRKHLTIFSASTPLGAIVSYGLFSYFGGGDVNRVGIALLISGGSFLYVATVLQPVSQQHSSASSPSEEVGKRTRISLLMLGIFIPFVIGSLLLGHDHQNTSKTGAL